ncbi:MAG TPA: transcriptional repressor [Candidatus Marinimicrobia bacterium]|nr:transcriptional repressor [Candidatus Neomarinimicrobiota bacterium]
MHNTDTLKRILHKENLRYTQQRQEVWDEICSTNEHRDAEDIYNSLRKRQTNVSRATVYRTIDVLVKNNLVRRLDLGDGRSRFENKMGIAHHDHIVCLDCRKIVEFMNEDIEEIQEQVAKEMGFEIVRHVHQLFGNCLDEKCPNK